MVTHLEALGQGAYTDRAWTGMIVLSVLCHVLFFSGVMFLPELRFTTPSMPSAVEVDLVSLPAATRLAKPPLGQAQVPPQVKTRPVKPSEKVSSVERAKKPEPVQVRKTVEFDTPPPGEAVSLASKPLRVKRSLKKKTYNVSKVITKAIAKIEKQAPESRPSTVLQAIDELKKKDQGTTGTVTTGDGPARDDIGRKNLELLDIYNAEIWYLIQKNWAFSEEMARTRTNLEGIIIVKIMRDGEIRDIWFESRSGNSYFDDSVLKAVKKSNPLPALPDGFLGPYYEVGIRFNPSELQRRP